MNYQSAIESIYQIPTLVNNLGQLLLKECDFMPRLSQSNISKIFTRGQKTFYEDCFMIPYTSKLTIWKQIYFNSFDSYAYDKEHIWNI